MAAPLCNTTYLSAHHHILYVQTAILTRAVYTIQQQTCKLCYIILERVCYIRAVLTPTHYFQQWYSGDDGIHCNRMDHLKHTCRHKQLYQRQDTDPKMWDISFPDSEECDKLLNTPK